MPKIISLFNHKGGVSKTTTTFNLGWALAARGSRVLIVDGDPQCNLTGTSLGLQDDSQFEQFYQDSQANLNLAVAPIFQGAAQPLSHAAIVPLQHERLFLLAGHIDLAENETQLAVALTTGAAIPALQNLPGAIGRLLRMTAEHHGIEYVLVDMSPSVGSLNECLLMGSDYFVVPTSPDYFCLQAVSSLSRILPAWNQGVSAFRNAALVYPLPSNPPKFLGTVSQRFRVYREGPAASFGEWIERIKQRVNQMLVPVLSGIQMTVTEDEFLAAGAPDTPFNLASIPEFNSLIALSQKHRVPIFALTEEQIGRQGVVLDNMITNRDAFSQQFDQLAQVISRLTA